MDLKNGYKVIYDKAKDGERTFYASKTGVFADAEQITTATIGDYKLIYEKDSKVYGSETGIPADTDYCFDAFNKVFIADEPVQETQVIPTDEQDDEVLVDDTESGPTSNEPETNVE